MKKLFIALSFVLALGLTASAQETKTIPTPDFLNQIYYYDPSTNSLKQLDRETAEVKGRSKGLVYGGSKLVWSVKGKTSTIIIPNTDNISFVVNVGENSMDLSTWFPLFRANLKGSRREAIYYEFNDRLGTEKHAAGIVRFDVKKIREKVYQIFPTIKLEKGEYFFLNNLTSPTPDVYCFTVQ